jgi:thiamine biosynthesis lipoprotein
MKPLSIPKFFLLIPLIWSCQQEPEWVQHTVSGPAQGSTFMISYVAKPQAKYASQIDSILVFFDQSMSIWVTDATISKLNSGDTLKPDTEFLTVLEKSREVHKWTKGAFDITVGPLVNAWGFGRKAGILPDSAQVDSLRGLIGMKRIKFDEIGRIYLDPGTHMDFNAIAQGYTVDVIAKFLESRGVKNYMVEVGGELRTKGENIDGKIWTIGIDKPQEEIDYNNRFQVIISLKNKGLATSGNYRKFYEDEQTGMRVAHTISPFTGFPSKNNLLSATVVAPDAMTADAYATAFMVMGLDETKKFLRLYPELQLEVYLVFVNYKNQWETWMTPGFKSMIK